MYRLGSLSLLLFGLVLPILSSAEPVRWKTSQGGNEHLYEAVFVPSSTTWTDAHRAAKERGTGWHLVTITSQEENDFVFSLVSENPDFWACCSDGSASGPWLGGLNATDDCSGGFQWVTGEAFEYTNWGPGEPNCSGSRLALFGHLALTGPTWTDHPDDFGPFVPIFGYIVESERVGDQVPGDCNQDGALDLSDAVCFLGFLFVGDPDSLPCGDGANLQLMDWQPDGAIDLSDPIALLTRLFLGGEPHPLAGPQIGATECVPIPGCPENRHCDP